MDHNALRGLEEGERLGALAVQLVRRGREHLGAELAHLNALDDRVLAVLLPPTPIAGCRVNMSTRAAGLSRSIKIRSRITLQVTGNEKITPSWMPYEPSDGTAMDTYSPYRHGHPRTHTKTGERRAQ